MFFSNKKNIFKNNIHNSIFTKERKAKSKDNLLFIKIPNRFDLSIRPVGDNKSQLYRNRQDYKNARTCKNFSLARKNMIARKDYLQKLIDRMNIRYRDPDFLCEYVHSKIVGEKNYFILLDEVKYVNEFEDVLISFLHIRNADVYVTGSNTVFFYKK